MNNWFNHAGLGLFVHWDHAGVRLLATGESLPFRTNVEVHNGAVPAEPTGELLVESPATAAR
jgi:hypothetical protein